MSFEADISRALEVLKSGGIILYPTDTIWGLGCDAANEDAVKRLYSLKRRADSKAMISLVDSLDTLCEWVETVPETALEEINKSGNRALTIIYDTPKGISNSLRAEDGSAAFRITRHKFSNTLCKLLGSPLVSTSANISGNPSPHSFMEIEEEIKAKADYICHEERNNINERASRILKIGNDGSVSVIRE